MRTLQSRTCLAVKEATGDVEQRISFLRREKTVRVTLHQLWSIPNQSMQHGAVPPVEFDGEELTCEVNIEPAKALAPTKASTRNGGVYVTRERRSKATPMYNLIPLYLDM